MSEDRRGLYGVLVFIGLLGLCLLFAFILLRQQSGTERGGAGPRIGVVEIEGVMGSAKEPLEQLRHWRKDKGIVAVVLRVRSPGGAVGPAQEIYREIERVRASKPVVASLETVAASGGYYVAAACNKIVANPGTLTGSIGVITQLSEISQLLSTIQVRTHTVKSGELKDVGSPLREMTEQDRAFLQQLADSIHAQFVRDVAKGRKLKVEQVRPVADGRVLTGEQALAAKLVDKLGNLSDALEVAAQLAGAKGEPVAVYAEDGKGLLRWVLEDAVDGLAQRLQSALSTTLQVR